LVVAYASQQRFRKISLLEAEETGLGNYELSP